ncbi:hypothetical protein BT96DRAFT_923031 [Gymnopus androsaceus JB14]|uniref:Uncharacterized protein n=1 Tax=Gymnopus androsaceus JB14 TaxID=1447944 RepID=A0A6A4HD39_9AGAR|nr:hypothetical protein BT96DRAFT_923031 [Gymnopus androsaceus JB14]
MLITEAKILDSFGYWLTYSVIAVGVSCIVLGAYVVVSVMALNLLCQKGLKRPAVLILFIIQVFLIPLAIWNVAILTGDILTQLLDIPVNSKLDGQLEGRISASNADNMAWEDDMWVWPANIILLFADIVVVWRAWVLWESSIAIRSLLLILVMCEGVANIVQSVYGSVSEGSSHYYQSQLQNLFLLLSLALNILATTLIAYRTWIHLKATRDLELSTHNRSQSLNVLFFLVESGAIFCINQAGYCIFIMLASSSSYNNTPSLYQSNIILPEVATIVLCFYPTSVIIVSHMMLYQN